MRATYLAALAIAAVQPAPAIAADLPILAEPIDYVEVCDAYGRGYYVIPGTDTCVRLGGQVRADYTYYVYDKLAEELSGGVGRVPFQFRARAELFLDSRTMTEFGLLRTYTELEFDKDNDDEVSVDLDEAFIEFGPFTFGRRQSFFDFSELEFTASQQFDWAISDTETNLFAVTVSAGDFSGTLSLEDAASRSTRIFGGRYQIEEVPDVVGVVRYTPWFGEIRAMAASHLVESRDAGQERGYALGIGGLLRGTSHGKQVTMGPCSRTGKARCPIAPMMRSAGAARVRSS